ncbi:MAG: tRNA epoxyqueuosine(34) reductase QueG [Gammaproteobacteria bacterium]|nr:tRNA epoxyqueuosine(34) reductase QueG [Gammaproteobacteria bacterium]
MPAKSHPHSPEELVQLAADIKQWGRELGFQQVGITHPDIEQAEQQLQHWLKQGHHGEMGYMASHGSKRSRPQQLIPGTRRIITVQLNYWPEPDQSALGLLEQADIAYISRYALGRDYHKLIRNRLQKLANRISEVAGDFTYRAFSDSAPVMEKSLAQAAGLGWVGKHTNLIHKQRGSWFFLGELYTDLKLPVDEPANNHCGQCQACIDICPTQAIVAPYELDARRCISYLTIELKGSIPLEFRPLIGNRIYGCDDCQLVCPWNRFATQTLEADFMPRHRLDHSTLVELFSWDEATFLKKMEGSAIRRIGHIHWLRNIAVALGNAPQRDDVITALKSRLGFPDEMVREHVVWGLENRGQTPV